MIVRMADGLQQVAETLMRAETKRWGWWITAAELDDSHCTLVHDAIQ